MIDSEPMCASITLLWKGLVAQWSRVQGQCYPEFTFWLHHMGRWPGLVFELTLPVAICTMTVISPCPTDVRRTVQVMCGWVVVNSK